MRAVLLRGTAAIATLGLGVACGPEAPHGTSEGEGTTTGMDVTTATTTTTTTTSAGPSSTSEGSTGSSGSTGLDPSCFSPWANATMIACAPNEGRVSLMASGTSVFFEAGGDIHRVDALDGSPATVLVPDAGDVFQMVVAGPHLYWVSFFDGELGRVPLAGGPPEVWAGLTKPNSVAVDASFAYVTQYATGEPLLKIGLDGVTQQTLYPDLDHAGRLLRDGTTLHWALSTNNGNVPTPIVRGSIDGAPMETVLSDLGVIEEMILEGDTMYVVRYGDQSRVEAIPVDPPGATQVLAATELHPWALGLTKDRVFWTEWGDGISRLQSVPRPGGAVMEHVSLGFGLLYGCAVVDQTVVVFQTPEGIARLDP